ncbi:hypothetical protein [Providencia sp. Me31A]|uniref:hypothetical protein n=1 Tax=Providencia sp. Me31A TaxID=3392637 RepID=UPI003D2DA01F
MTSPIHYPNSNIVNISANKIHFSISIQPREISIITNNRNRYPLHNKKQTEELAARKGEKTEFLSKWTDWAKKGCPDECRVEVLKHLASALLNRTKPDLSGFNLKLSPPLPEFMQK